MTQLVWTPAFESPVTFATQIGIGYRILTLDGIGPVKVAMVASKTPGQPGRTAHDVTVSQRVIACQFLIQAEGMAELWLARAALSASVGQETTAVLAVMQTGTLVLKRGYGLADLQIDAIVSDLSMALTPKASSYVLAADITFDCPYPFWQPTSDTTVNVPTASTPVNCSNTGDAAAIVTYKLGPMISPTVTNTTTGKMFKINATIPSGKHLLVYIGNRLHIMLDDDSTHAQVDWAKYLDHTKKYVTQLAPGTNNIEWAPASGSPSGTLDVIYRPQVRGA